jgi:hypothetical protein
MAKKVAKPARNSVKKKLPLRSLGCTTVSQGMHIKHWKAAYMTGTLKAKVSAHKGVGNRHIGVVNPARHDDEKFCRPFKRCVECLVEVGRNGRKDADG